MTPPTSSGFGTTMRTSRKSYSRKTLTHVSPGSMISSSTSDSDNSLHSLYFTSYHGLINYPQKIPAFGHVRCRMDTHGGHMGVKFVGHTVDPVANVPFPQPRTQLHREPHMLADNQGGFMPALNITAVKHRKTDRP